MKYMEYSIHMRKSTGLIGYKVTTQDALLDSAALNPAQIVQAFCEQ